MQRLDSDSVKSLEDYSEILNNSGYDSVLTVYHSTIADNWIKAARVLNKKHKLKYMIAVRTYAISPEYCAMMCKAFYEIQKDRLILNILAGDFQKEENSIDNVLEINDIIRTYEDRVIYTKKWMDKFIQSDIFKKDPKIKPILVLSGSSKQTVENSEKYGDGHLTTYSKYKYELNSKVNTKIKMVYVEIIIRDTYEEAIKYIPKNSNEIQMQSTIAGTELQIIEKFKEMEKEGITDIMVCRKQEDKEQDRIHNLIKKLTNI